MREVENQFFKTEKDCKSNLSVIETVFYASGIALNIIDMVTSILEVVYRIF